MSHPVWDSQRLDKFSASELAGILRNEDFTLDDRADIAGIFGINNPRLLIDGLADGLPRVDEFAVDLIERARARLQIGAALLYGPLSERPLSAAARSRAIAVLGLETSGDAIAILERLERRAPSAEERKAVRRERLRSGTRAIEPAAAKPPEGSAVLRSIGSEGQWHLDINENLPGGRFLSTGADPGPERVEHWAILVRDGVWSGTANHPAFADVSLGHAKTLLESLPSKHRLLLAPVLDRLRDVTPEPLPRPAPKNPLSISDARALVIERSWDSWFPFAGKTKWSQSSLLRVSLLSPPAFPGHPEELENTAASDVQRALKQPTFVAKIARGLEFMALHAQFRGDARASSVAADGVLAVRRRQSHLIQALAERERWRGLWARAPFPIPWRQGLRSEFVSIGRGLPVSTIERAQKSIEETIRIRRSWGWTPGLPDPSTLDLGAALADAEIESR